MKMREIFIIFISILFSFALAPAAESAWVYTTVDNANKVGDYSSIAVDQAGFAHISYYDEPNGNLKYATNASGAWAVFTIDNSASDVGIDTSIAVDQAGFAHISYSTNPIAGWGSMRYITNRTGAWQNDAYPGDQGQSSSLAIDQGGNVHIAYQNAAGLRYVTKSNLGVWSAAVTLDPTCFADPSLAIDNNGQVHISYENWSGGFCLKHAYGPPWQFEQPVCGGGSLDSIAIDQDNKVHISYFNIAPPEIRYINNISGWGAPVSIGGGWQERTSLAIDSSNNAHIIYKDFVNNLIYATNTSGAWLGNVFAANNQSSSLAISSNCVDVGLRVREDGITQRICGQAPETLHVSYYEDSDGVPNLNYAYDTVAMVMSPLRIGKGGVPRGIVLVDPADASASRVRVRTGSGDTKSLKRILP